MRQLSNRIPCWSWLALSLGWAVLPLSGQPDDQLSVDQLVNSSDLIVVGSFQYQAVDSSEEVTRVSGVITVAEVLWGDMLSFLIGEVHGDEKVPISWQVEPDRRNPVDWKADTGQGGIWLLMGTDTGGYRADGPRYLSRWKRFLVVRSLQKNRVIVRRTSLCLPSDMMVDLIVRSTRKEDAVVPDFSFENGMLQLHPDVSLTVCRAGARGRVTGSPLASIPGRVLSLGDEEWIVVASGEEHLVRLDLAELFDLDRQTEHKVEFQIAGFGKSTLALPATVSP
ncbi:hypothetical protein ACFL4K_02740 [Candidatus Neomarinimicrobiota bacterium]